MDAGFPLSRRIAPARSTMTVHRASVAAYEQDERSSQCRLREGGSIPAFSQGLITPFSGNPQVRVARWYINLKTIEAGSLMQVPAFLVTCKVRSLRSYSGYTSIEESGRTARQTQQPGWTCAELASPGGYRRGSGSLSVG